jgi:hypothetical protein
VTQPGVIPGFSDVYTPHPYITNYGFTFDWTISPTTFLEVTYGSIKNELAGGNEAGILNDAESNRQKSLAAFPELYPNSGVVDPQSYAFRILQTAKPPFRDGKSVNLPPVFGWGTKIGAAPPQQRYPGFLSINHTQDIAGSVTKIVGRHTLKAGAYLNHSYKPQNVGAGGIANLTYQG